MSTPVKKVPIHLQSSQNRLLIKHGKVVNEDTITEDDVYIEDGIIKQLGRNLIIPGGTRVIDARGKYILPGGIDPHTHMEFEFMGSQSVDDFYQGTKAAVAGGTTMIIDFAIPRNQQENPLDAYFRYREKADDKVCCDYGLHVGLINWNDRIKKEVQTLVEQHGINSFKVFMAYSFKLDDSQLYEVFDTCQQIGAVAQVHAENGAIIDKNVEKLLARGVTGPEGHELSRPEEVEAEAVNRACVIAKQVNAPIYILNVTTGLSGELIGSYRRNGLQVFGEVRVGNVAINGDPKNSKLIASPVIRSNSDIAEQLLDQLASGILQVTGSDNCTFNSDQKALGKGDFSKIPNGVNGVEDRMSVIWEKGVQAGILDPCKFVAVTSTNAAKIFNLYPRKGCIAIGSDADVVIWDPVKTRTISAKTHHQAVDFNIFEGMVCHGVPDYVIVNGRVCVDDGQLRVAQGYGRFVETAAYPPYVYDPEKLSELRTNNGTAHNNDQVDHASRKVSLDERSCATPTLPESAVQGHHAKGAKPEGQRDIQASTFSISEELDLERKSCIRVRNPPGGKSSGFW